MILEPLRKFLTPILGLMDTRADFWLRAYYLLLLGWLLLVWGFFGGVITRMSLVQIAGKDGGGLRESIRFVRKRYLSYLISPLFPVAMLFLIVLGLMVVGVHLIPLFGDIVVDGLFWWIPLGAGFMMAVIRGGGLVGYPLMYTTLSRRGAIRSTP